MLRTGLVSVFAVLLFIAPARADDVRAAIDALDAKVVADSDAGDAKAVAASYTDDAVMLAPDATRVNGREGVEALWKSWIDAGMKNLTLKSTEVGGSGDLAYALGEFTQQVPLKGGEIANVTGNYLSVLKRGDDGAWRIWLEAWEGKHE